MAAQEGGVGMNNREAIIHGLAFRLVSAFGSGPLYPIAEAVLNAAAAVGYKLITKDKLAELIGGLYPANFDLYLDDEWEKLP